MTKQSEVYPCKFCIEHGLNESNGCGCWDRDKHTDTDELRVRELIRYRVTQEYQKYHNEAGFKYSGKEFWVDQIVWKLGEALEEIITAYTTAKERALLDELEEAMDSDELLEFLKSKRELQNQTSKEKH